jgi:hypothetical protein
MNFQHSKLPEQRSLRSLSAASALMLCGLFASGSSVSQEQSDAEDFKPNGIELFVGATLSDGDGEASFGIDYERRISQELGLGLMVEYTDGREWVIAIPVSLHITESWKIVFALGAELSPDEVADKHEFLQRIGTSYEFGFNGWSLAPELNVDFAGGERKTVVGVSFGWDFR